MPQVRLFAVAVLWLGAELAAHAEQHPVFSLVDNRPLAHLQRRGGLYLEAGAAGMARYIHFSRPLSTWKLGATEEGRRVALASSQAVLEVPLTAEQARPGTLWLGLKAPARSSIRVTVGKGAPVTVPLGAGWQVAAVTLPPGTLVAGENRLNLSFAQSGPLGGQRAAAAVEFVQIGGQAPTAADPAGKGPALPLPPGGGLAYYAFVPDGAALSASGDGGGCKVNVALDGRPVGELRLDGTPLDLAAGRGHFARLDVAASTGCRGATLGRADLGLPGPAARPPARKAPRNVIFWLSDSTRADKFRIYNPKTRVESPFMTELAKRATVFESAYVQGNESRVSHASLFAGVYPSVHKMIPETAKLPDTFTILPEAVRGGKRWVGGVMANGFIDKFWGFGDGWDYLHNRIKDGTGLRGGDLLAEARKHLTERGANPFFLYVGSIDAHVSWRAHEPWLSRYDQGYPANGPFIKACLDPTLDKIVAGTLKITERDKVRIHALYDSDISYTDSIVQQLFDTLHQLGRDDDTMFVFTADHGEEMWDHGKVGHGQSLHEELVHVPLVIYYPPYFPPGKVVTEGVDVLDLLPTITDALEVPTPAAAQGESLIPLAAGVGAGYPRPSIASQYELAHAMRLGGYKLWVGGSGDARLYDVRGDPAEASDLWTRRPVERRALTDALGLWMQSRSQWKKRRWGVASNLKPEYAADMNM